MALAYLAVSSDLPPAGDHQFVADLGSNGFYEYEIGTPDPQPQGPPWGLARLANVVHRSGLQPRPRDNLSPLSGRFALRVPARLFSREAHHIQLTSYRDQRRSGPAYSPVITMPAGISGGAVLREPGLLALEDPFSRLAVPAAEAMGMTTPLLPARRLAFSFQESQLSRPLFLDQLVSLLRAAAPTLLAQLPGLLGGIGAPPPPSGTPAASGTNDLAPLLELLAHLGRLQGANATPAPAAPAPAQAQSRQPNRYRGATGPRLEYGHAMTGALLSGPLLASLLGPLLQQAPQLLQILTDRPLQFFTTLLQSRLDNRLQQQQNQQQFVANLLAEANRSALLRELLATLPTTTAPPTTAQGFSLAAGPPRPAPSERFGLTFVAAPALPLGGKSKWVYQPDSGITLVWQLLDRHAQANLPPLPRAILELALIDLESQQTLLRHSERLSQLQPGAPLKITLSADQLRALPRHRDLNASAVLRWPVRGGSRGVQVDHPIYLADHTLLMAVDRAGGRERPLNDPQRYRAFWHKLYEGGVAPGSRAVRWELDLLCRYYLRATFEQPSNGRVDSRLALAAQEPDDRTHKLHGRLKSGMELSLEELAKLLPLLFDQPPLEAGLLAALKSSELRPLLDLQATTHLRFSGKRSQVGVIWVYPEVTLAEIRLGDVTEVDPNGQVLSTRERRVPFPLPSSLHFVALKSD